MAKKQAKGAAKTKFIAVGENSDCEHEEFATMAAAAQDSVDNGYAENGGTVKIYQLVGEFDVKTKATITVKKAEPKKKHDETTAKELPSLERFAHEMAEHRRWLYSR